METHIFFVSLHSKKVVNVKPIKFHEKKFFLTTFITLKWNCVRHVATHTNYLRT